MTHYRTARPTLAQWVKQHARLTRRAAWAMVCPAGAIIQQLGEYINHGN